MKKNLSILFFLVSSIVAIAIISQKHMNAPQVSAKPAANSPVSESNQIRNVLFVSFCSVNANHLPTFGANISDGNYPNMSRLFNSSFNFTSAYTNLSWSNASRYFFSAKQIGSLVKRAGILDAVENDVKVNYIHVGGELDVRAEYKQYFTDDRINLPLYNLDTITREIDKRNTAPYTKNLWVIHFKLMHYPYLSSNYLSSPAIMKKVFSDNELKLISEYRKNPEQYPDKFAFFQIAFGDKKFEKLFFNKENQYVAYVTDLESVARWKRSKNSDIDLSILKKSYNLRLTAMDELVGKILDYYSKIEHNTVLIASGDHGESITEHDYFSHGFIPYDEVIRFFYSIHFPFQQQKQIITAQINQSSTSKIVNNILKDGLTEDSFMSTQVLKTRRDDYIMSFSCAGDIASIRIKNTWKFIYFINEDRYRLFDLISDPNESIDVSKINTKNENLSAALKINILDVLATRQVSKSACFK
ncbi:MAG: sulfatase-like hydrolase/transferase [Bacteriovorax sp.]|jgi:hypothetical protein